MKFRNKTDDALVVPSLGVIVEAGDTTRDLSKSEAAGFELQADVWEPVTKSKSDTTTQEQD